MPTPRTPTLDDTDHRLLALLQQDAGHALHELCDLVGLSPSAVRRRLARYRAAGLQRQIAVLDPDALGVTLAIVLVTIGMAHCGRLEAHLFMDDPNVKRYVTLPVFDPVKTGLALPTWPA